MRIVNMAHGSLYAIGAYVTAWLIGRAIGLGLSPGWLFLLLPLGAVAVALAGAVIEPLLLRPFYPRAEEYQLLVTFGLLLILEDVMRFVWGGLPLSADALVDAVPSPASTATDAATARTRRRSHPRRWPGPAIPDGRPGASSSAPPSGRPPRERTAGGRPGAWPGE